MKIKDGKLSQRAFWISFRNEFDFWNVFGIMNTSGLMQSRASVFTLTLQETRSIHDSMNIQKLNLLLIFTFYYKYLKYDFFLL